MNPQTHEPINPSTHQTHQSPPSFLKPIPSQSCPLLLSICQPFPVGGMGRTGPGFGKMAPTLSYGGIFRFWLPLASTWLMISVEGPLLAALIARLADPTLNLAAYGVAFSFALIIEAPILMIMSASTALSKDADSFRKMRNFTFLLNFLITALMVLALLPPVFRVLAVDLIGLPDDVAGLTHTAMLLLLPWPGVIGYRRFYQGLLIRNNLTRRVAYGTVVRLSTMAATSFGLYFFSRLPGAWVGAAALSAGVTMEAVASRFMAGPTVARLTSGASAVSGPELEYRYIFRFYIPLAMTSMLSLAVHPMITFFVGQSRLAIESLAVIPVVTSLVFVFRSLGLAFQEVAIALMGDDFQGYTQLRNFAGGLMVAATAGLCLIAFTPLQRVWFHEISGLPTHLAVLAGSATRILAPMPGLAVLLCFQRAMLVNLRITRFISWSTAIEIGGIAATLFCGIHLAGWAGAVAAALALLIGRLGANLYLLAPLRAFLRLRLVAPQAQTEAT